MFMTNPENSNKQLNEIRISLSIAFQAELEMWGASLLEELEKKYQSFETKQTLRNWIYKTRE